jgi:tRNA-dihydrouridine synthase B
VGRCGRQAEHRRLSGQAAAMLALAPMQDVTDLAFWRVMARHGGADLIGRSTSASTPIPGPEKYILDSITENPTGRPSSPR